MKKIVFVTSRFPYPLDKGDKLRAYHQIKHLSQHCEIHLLSLSREKVTKNDYQELEKYCTSVTVYSLSILQSVLGLFWALFRSKPFQVGLFYNKKIKRKIASQIREIKPNHLYCQLIRAAEYVKDEYDIPKTIDFMDVLSKGIERRIATSPFLLKRALETEAERLKVYENILYEYFDNHTIISSQDQELIYHTEREKIAVIPNGIDTDYFFPTSGNEKKYTFLFNGNMQYQPNVTCAVYIVEKIMPLIWAKYPQATVLISGTSPTAEVLNLASDKVIVSGWMDDIRDAYNQALIFVAPMQIGTGLQNKLLEAMAMNLPCVTSKLANNALQAEHEKEILIGKSKEEYALLMESLLQDQALRTELGTAGKTYVEKNFNWESTVNQLRKLMDL